MGSLVFVLTKVASAEGFLVAVGVILMLTLWRRDARSAVALFLCAAGVLITTGFLKEALQVPRPLEALIETTGYAFPSGHAAGATFLALIVAYFCRRLRAPARYLAYAACALSAITINWSRIVFHVHTPLQVAVGFLVGVLFALLFIKFSIDEDSRPL